MSDTSEGKSAAELQREVEAQRHRVEDTIDQLQEKLSPGQLVDELMNYGKVGGGEFLSGLASTAQKNPLPVALLGISLVWLMAKPNGSSTSHQKTDREWDQRLSGNGENRYASYAGQNSGRETYGSSTYAGSSYSNTPGSTYAGSNASGGTYGGEAVYDPYEGDDTEYPTASVQGSVIQRLGHVTDEGGKRYAEFVDDAGKKFRALTDSTGNRAGHFMDEAGNRYRGFTDAAGGQIDQFRDEAGNLLEAATEWASHTWAAANRRLHDARDALTSGARGLQAGASSVAQGASSLTHRAGDFGGQMSNRASGMGGNISNRAGNFGGQLSSRATAMGGQVQTQADDMIRSVQNLLQDQPLVGGAVAFAIGAALGSALPRTSRENELMGEAADNLKSEAAQRAAQLYEQGKEQVGTLYETAQGKASQIMDQAKEGLEYAREGLDHAKQGVVSSLSTTDAAASTSSTTGTSSTAGLSSSTDDSVVGGGTTTSTRTVY